MTEKSVFVLGIDTGGTYTDAVIIDRNKRSIIASAKAITTKGNLEVGVGEAMSRVLDDAQGALLPDQIRQISVSTTLATNAVVEGHGTNVAVVLIGFDEAMARRAAIAQNFPAMPLIHVAGGHDHNGDAVQLFDENGMLDQCGRIAHAVSAFAVVGAFAVRNAAHEIKARDALIGHFGKPVTVSTEMSSSLDAPRRALTATLNARLISRITQLVESVQRASELRGIKCPLMVVKGDGSLARAEAVAVRPIETILSGPAASMMGAKWLSGENDFIMSDIGGTTTDVGIMAEGQPQVSPQGATVGGWRTMVRAIDVKTVGLGGDSEVHIGLNGALTVGPERALPVSLLAHRHPETVAMLEADLAQTEGGSTLGKFLVLPFGKSAAPVSEKLSDREEQVLAMVGSTPVPLRKVAASSAAMRTVQALRKKGLLQLAAFTPSDAAHVLGLQDNWPGRAAGIAAAIAVRFRTMKMPDDEGCSLFCHEVWSATVARSARVILETALGEGTHPGQMLDAVCEGRHQMGLVDVSLRPRVPVVAVGGPARVYYPEVAKRLGCDVRFVPHFSVANAVGAATGAVLQAVVANVEGDGQGQFRLHVDGETFLHTSGAAALQDAIARAEAAARRKALADGAVSPRIKHSVAKRFLPDAQSDDGLLAAEVRAEAMDA